MLLCPICGGSLEKQTGAYVCENRHSFDIARQGYVNLLPVQQKRWRQSLRSRTELSLLR